MITFSEWLVKRGTEPLKTDETREDRSTLRRIERLERHYGISKGSVSNRENGDDKRRI